MLQSFDTLIAFVTILTICSLFVLICVQMISAALSLRGKNMANALALSFQTVAPELGNKAHLLAQRILSDPLLSDSVHPHKDRTTAPGSTPAPGESGPMNILPSLLGISAGFSRWANSTALPLANAIRPQEVLAAIKNLAAKKDEWDKATADLAAATTALANAATDDAKKKAQDDQKTAQSKVDLLNKDLDLFNAAKTVSAGFGSPDDVVAKDISAVQTIVDTLDENIPGLTQVKQDLQTAIANSAQTLTKKITTAESEVEGWLNAAQDRAQQWFQSHTRGFTIFVSIGFAFVLQWDAVEIFKRVSSDSATRDALVKASSEVAKLGDVGSDPNGGLIHRIVVAWNLQKDHSDPSKKLSEAGVLHTRDLRQKVEAMTTTPPEQTQALLASFDALVEDQTQSYFVAQQTQLKDLEAITKNVGYQLIPDGGLRWGCSFAAWGQHFFGMALFAALLTLGAPYWFNMLAQLANLRPALAQLMGQEDEDKKKAGTA